MMARPREFDEETVLDKAMELFWSKGFEKTSIQDLCEHTGVHRGSLYETFGDKNDLFLAALDRFRHHSAGKLFAVLEEPGNPKEQLAAFFERLIERSMDNANERRGCLIANTAVELAPFDPKVASRVEASLLDMENRFYSFLLRAQKEGGLKGKRNLRELSRFLVGVKQGVHIMAKTTTDPKTLQDVYKVALSAIF
ncbi:TetR/AcrR family transcriptional repressor of nem operon [Paenibacillus forsythiae]|uniref:TetR/AcrR family transcriptional repressor of nem operon n=1 Tax=Paenibacillus forsythiae TaxID=365616 RepID=A0ABU3H1W8_9BACL|nr:TetR/AcrR family transcriptional regulator [Paenibacillus forsythiae]MDT3424811.1 TetR/AcrR family transcriptional repressor of nem operon [Paenibacillus forsythiae]